VTILALGRIMLRLKQISLISLAYPPKATSDKPYLDLIKFKSLLGDVLFG
jgi:hypothetical protein